MELYEGIERREFLRLDYETPVKFTVCSDKEVFGVGDGVTKNVSASGVLFTSRETLNVGSFLSIKLDPHTFTDVVEIDDDVVHFDGKLLGKIVRVEEIVVNKKYDIGVCFVKSDEYSELDTDKIEKILTGK
ncbi:PilZ domain-containing protein [bacterium]|nr:PilZ domain-containing protein [bacterium]